MRDNESSSVGNDEVIFLEETISRGEIIDKLKWIVLKQRLRILIQWKSDFANY